jgi:1-phosphatidylinositol-3-phosphate 5-kinase
VADGEDEDERALGGGGGGGGGDAGLVLFDADLMALTRGFPLPLAAESRRRLDAALRRDCAFLEACDVVDYSLLVGIEPAGARVRVGLIDYLRRFDIVKRVENRVKAVAQLATNIEPTVVQPRRYAERLLRASERYFAAVPDVGGEEGSATAEDLTM